MPRAPTILLRLSDLPQAERAGIEPVPLVARDAALLAWLAIEGPTARDQLCALLWPDSGTEQSRTTLRQRLFRLKQALGQDLATGTPVLELAPGVGHDLEDATELLGNLTVAHAPELDAWLRRQRERRREREHEALQAQADALEGAGEVEAALQVAQALLRLQPLSELAHQRVMRLHHLRGDRAAALAAFDACEQVLKHELGTAPSPATLALLGTLERAQTAARVAPMPAAVLRPPRLVGREAEFARMQQAWLRPAIVLLEGEAGMGKSRLLSELVSTLGSAQQPAIMVSARPGDEQAPLALAGRLVRALLDQARPQLPAGDGAELGRLLPGFDEPPALDPGARPTRLLGAIARLVAQARAAGLRAIVVDDLHFADSASVDLLASLVDGASPLWALAYRSAELATPAATLVRRWCEQLQAEPIVLQPLDQVAVAELLGSLQLGDIDLDAAAAALRRHTGGNPMFLLETLKTQLASGAADWSHPPVAENVRQLIQRRLGRLSAAALRLARLAAVARRDFSAELAVQVLQTGPLDLADAWNELEQAQVFEAGRFSHDLIFEATRASVPEPLARQLHAEIARRLAEGPAAPASIAEHAFEGGDWALAAPACERAGQLARRDGLAATAQQFFQRAAVARARLGDEQGRFEALRSAVESSTHRALDDETERQLDELAALAQGDAQQLAVDVLRLEVLGRLMRVAEAGETGLRALATARRIGHFEWGIQAATVVALVQGAEPEAEVAQGLLEAGEWIATQAPEGLELEKSFCLGAIHNCTGRLVEAVQCLEEAARVGLRQGRHESASSVLINAASTLSRIGWPERALQASLQSLSVIDQADDGQRGADLAHKALQIASFQRDAGCYAEAVAGFERLLPSFVEQGDQWRTAVCRQRLAVCFGQLGQFARTQPLLGAPDADLPAQRQAIPTMIRIELQHLAGGAMAAHAASARALVDAPQAGEWHHHAVLSAVLALPPGEGRPWLVETERYYERRGMWGLQAIALARLARLSRLAGDTRGAAEAARAALARGADHAPSGLYRPELWLEAALALHGAGDDRAARAAVQDGVAWVRRVLPQVPPAFRSSFTERNAINRQLLAGLAPR